MGRVTDFAYLAAAVLFVFALRGLGNPRTAIRGNVLGATGMLIAVAVTLLGSRILRPELLLLGLILGGLLGVSLAVKVPMTGIPELVALFNGLGGGASALVASTSLIGAAPQALSGVVSALIGTTTFSGSLVAMVKLRGRLEARASRALQQGGVILSGGATVASGTLLISEPDQRALFVTFIVLALAFGVALVMPIGGADMPVVVAFLNACSGLAAASTGFVLMNQALIISGSLVGASGFILTNIMCRAMNRSLGDVLFGGTQASRAGAGGTVDLGTVKATSAVEVAMMLEAARLVMIVPGYGMALAQAQHAVAALAKKLREGDVEVLFAIHPVAGRMPGHMNVLLAEANVAYESLLDLPAANPRFVEADVVLVVGANDVVNPAARTDRESPIFGMPILDVDKAKIVVVLKRSLGAGFAGVPNPLFGAENTVMLFGDAKESLIAIAANL
jgi:NAD(P) transhydrogenase subunit beta